MKILHMMVGLPRSGKSTKAKELGHPIVCPDAIRLATHGTLWRIESEPLVWGIARTMVEALFLAGHNEVILDACNHTKDRRRIWESSKWVIKHYVVDVDMDTCIARAKASFQDDLVPVIQRMGAAWDPPGMEGDC
jgi:predicted kinase